MRRKVVAAVIGVTSVIAAGGVAEAALNQRPGGPFGILGSSFLDSEKPATGAAGPMVSSRSASAPPEKQQPVPGLGEPLQIGTVQQVDKTLDFASTKRIVLHYPKAEYIKPHFSTLRLAPGQYLRVSDPKGTESRVYAPDGLPVATSLVLELAKLLPLDTSILLGKEETSKPATLTAPVSGVDKWAMTVPGDTAIVELISKKLPLPSDAVANFGVNIDKVATGTPRDELAARASKRRPTESVCRQDDKKDVACYRSQYPVEFEHSKPVARLLINGVEMCTGWRIGPNNRMLTNQHCIVSQAEAASVEVWFNYECQICGGFLPSASQVTKVMGDKLIATDETLDFTLFTVRDFESISGFGYLEFDDRRVQRGEEIYIPQHPGGRTKQLALVSDEDRGANCKVSDPSYDGYARNSDISYYCDTEGGSSGSPVLSRKTHKVIALHHFGGCPNSGVRVDLIAQKIAHKL